MHPCLSQVCSLHSSFEKDIEDYAAGACRSVELWLGKLETYLESHSVADAKALLEQYEMSAPVASYQGGLLTSQGEARRQHWDHFARRLDILRTLGVETLVVAADITGPLNDVDIERAQVSLAEAAQAAANSGVRLALEFQSRSTFVNNLQTAAALLTECGSPSLGLCFDVFHFYLGPSKLEDLGYVPADMLFHVQLSDLEGVARELASDSDRILPGDGDFQLEPIVGYLRQINYTGCVSIELMNPQIWQVPARQFGEIAMTALRRLLGQAEMGA